MSAIRAFYRQEDGKSGNLLTSLDEVREFLDGVRADSITYDAPLLVQCYPADDPETSELALGIHHDRGVLYYSSKESPGPWYSDGDKNLGDDEIDYDYMGNATPFQMDNHVPYPTVLAVAEEFFERGTKPNGVAWRTDA